MEITNPDVEEYCRARSAPASPERQELAAYTRENCELSRMLIGELEGSLLQMLITLSRARRVLEIGCFTGYSALTMAEALPADGEVVTLDVDPETNRIAQDFWGRSPHGDKIRAVVGDAHETLRDLAGPFDLVFIDADKEGYPDYFERSMELLSPAGLVVLDNALMGGEVLAPDEAGAGTRAVDALNRHVAERADLRTVLLPVRDGLMLIQRV